MSLINYIEPVNAGAVFSGLGMLIFAIVFIYIIRIEFGG